MNHRVVLTDSTDGIGHVFASALHDRGTPTVLIETVPTANHLPAYPTISATSDYPSLRAAYTSADTVLGGIDILINVACVKSTASLPITHREQIHSQFATHLGDVALFCSIGMGFMSDRTIPTRLMNIWLSSDANGHASDTAWHPNVYALIAIHTEYLARVHAHTGTKFTSFVQHTGDPRGMTKDTQAILAWIQGGTTGALDGHSGHVITLGQRASVHM